jgi:hypothetical protein
MKEVVYVGTEKNKKRGKGIKKKGGTWVCADANFLPEVTIRRTDIVAVSWNFFLQRRTKQDDKQFPRASYLYCHPYNLAPSFLQTNVYLRKSYTVSRHWRSLHILLTVLLQLMLWVLGHQSPWLFIESLDTCIKTSSSESLKEVVHSQRGVFFACSTRMKPRSSAFSMPIERTMKWKLRDLFRFLILWISQRRYQ